MRHIRYQRPGRQLEMKWHCYEENYLLRRVDGEDLHAVRHLQSPEFAVGEGELRTHDARLKTDPGGAIWLLSATPSRTYVAYQPQPHLQVPLALETPSASIESRRFPFGKLVARQTADGAVELRIDAAFRPFWSSCHWRATIAQEIGTYPSEIVVRTDAPQVTATINDDEFPVTARDAARAAGMGAQSLCATAPRARPGGTGHLGESNAMINLHSITICLLPVLAGLLARGTALGDQAGRTYAENELHARPAVRVTVGLRDADIVGSDNRALQAAVDYVGNLGGGVVEIGPGEYLMRDALHAAQSRDGARSGRKNHPQEGPRTPLTAGGGRRLRRGGDHGSEPRRASTSARGVYVASKTHAATFLACVRRS